MNGDNAAQAMRDLTPEQRARAIADAGDKVVDLMDQGTAERIAKAMQRRYEMGNE